MDPIKAKFFQADFEVSFRGHGLQMRGLFSDKGITKIHYKKDLPEAWGEAYGKAVVVGLDTLKLKGVLFQQFAEGGMFFEIRFYELEPPVVAYLQQRVEIEGISPGWVREFPRIPVQGVKDPELPMPSMGILRFGGEEHFVEVANFTLGGIRVEVQGNHLGDLRVGTVVSFDLVASSGDVLNNMSAEVRNIAMHERENERKQKHTTRSFGLKFVQLDPRTKQKYRNLIRDYCLILQRRYDDKS